MRRYTFASSSGPTLGVEIELNLVDAQTLALRSGVTPILENLPPELQGSVKPELFQCYLEINTAICRDVAEVERDLTAKIKVVEQVARNQGMLLYWGGAHPFSRWQDQEVTPDERYLGLVDLLQETARRLVTYGLHVHVGLDSGDKAIMMCDRILPHLPMLLALSVNSPFWQGRNTGLHSHRIKIMETLPTSGLPPLMRNWSEYTWLLNHMIETGFIKTVREIWWDVRPHHNFGTIEVRICDMPPSLHHVLGLTALVQCLVHDLSEEIDRGTYQLRLSPLPDPPEQMARLPIRNGGQPRRPAVVRIHSGPHRSFTACSIGSSTAPGAGLLESAGNRPRTGRPADRLGPPARGLPADGGPRGGHQANAQAEPSCRQSHRGLMRGTMKSGMHAIASHFLLPAFTFETLAFLQWDSNRR